MRGGVCIAVLLTVSLAAAQQGQPLLSLNSADGVKSTFARADAPSQIEVVTGQGNTTDGDGALHWTGAANTAEGSKYFGVMVPFPEPVDLRNVRLLLDAKSAEPANTKALYVRLYNRGEAKPCLSWQSWNGPLTDQWTTFAMQAGLNWDGLSWEPTVVEDRVPSQVDRMEVIIGTRDNEVTVDASIDNLRTAEPVQTLQDLAEPKKLVRETVLVRGGQSQAVVLRPEGEAGAAAAAAIVAAAKERTGVELPSRVATADDRQPEQTAILLGNVDTNPALLLFYSRYLSPVDSLCPGPGGSLVHTVGDPFGKGVNAVVVGASDDAGLANAAQVLVEAIAQQPKGGDLNLPRLFAASYGEEFLRRYGWADDEPRPKRLEEGLAEGQRALDQGAHTSIAGVLSRVAQRYELTGQSVEAKVFVGLWDLYVQSAVADPRKFGGPWGFDSDFPSAQVVTGWDVIEEDPSLTDEERLRVTKAMGRWLAEAVVPKCAGAARTSNVLFNHQTFPGLGSLFAGLYFTQGLDVIEGHQWLGIADAMFRHQMEFYKVNEDCNGYQWLTNGHVMHYAVARPDYTIFENGNGQKTVDYLIGVMDNLGYQVPYGDTGSWQCWNSEMICLDRFAFATGDPAATWAANLKRQVKRTFELYSFYRPGEGTRPDRFNGVHTWPLEPRYYATFRDESAPPIERCFDKVSFREAMDPQAAYLLLDGLSNGGHKHLDGNSLPRLTQYGRIWLADNDYYKAQVKYHNSVLVFKDGQATAMPSYVELMGSGESERYGYSRTRVKNYGGCDWDRTVVWLKPRHAFLVLDRLVPNEADEYQFRLLWHGVGAPELSDQGMLLRQKGPAMWIQPGLGPQQVAVDDEELGSNWSGYPYADPVVHSLNSVATVKLEQGQPYLFATVLHGAAEGDPAPWRMSYLDGLDGVLVTTPEGAFAVSLGPVAQTTADGQFRSDAEVLVLDTSGLSLMGATRAEFDNMVFHTSAEPSCADIAQPEAAAALDMLPLRPPVPNLVAGTDAPAQPVTWEQRPQPERLIVSGNRGLPGAVDLGAKLTSDPAPAEHNVFSPDAPNTPDALLDGDFANNTGTSVMYEPDRAVTLTLDLGAAATVARVRWYQWWSTTSSKNTSYLLKQATVAVSNDGFQADSRQLGVVTDAGPHGNFGLPIEYTIEGKGEVARYVRLVVEPQAGSAVYLSELLVEGKPEGNAVEAAPYHFTSLVTAQWETGAAPGVAVSTREGAVLALTAEGAKRWTAEFPDRVNDLAAADLDGDGRDELVVARQDGKVTVLDDDGTEQWSREIEYYRTPPYVNIALAGDIDGDGTPEVVIGGNNWRFYAYQADGTALWNYESVHPSRSGAVADLDGDGKDEVICGTHYYWASTLGSDGTLKWQYRLGPVCYAIATGSFDGDQTRGVLFGGGDGFIHYVSPNGEARLKYNTGDEVKQVAAADLDGDGKDEVLAGSMNYSVYCFGADTQRRWRVDLGSAITGLATVAAQGGGRVVAGTAAGRVATIDRDGKLVAASDLGAPVLRLVRDGDQVVVATADGRLRRLQAEAR